MQVLLLNPRSGFLAEPAFAPPLGLLYLGTALERFGVDVRVVDLNLPDREVAGHDPRLIGITCVTANWQAVRELVAECGRQYPGVPVVVGGPHLSTRPWDGDALGARWSADGDGEDKITYLTRHVAKGFGVPAGRLPDWGEVDVDVWPIPARHLVPIQEYACALDGRPATTLVTQRGCPFACAFCSRWDGARRVRARAIPNVIDEVRELKADGFRSLIFHDDEINLKGERLLNLCAALERERVRFKANARADLLTEQQADALARAGCSWLCFGVESGNAGILETANKGTTPAVNSRARQLCRRNGIKFKAFVIAGLPGETHETLRETREWLIENEVDDLGVTMFVAFPGSDIYERPNGYEVTCDRDYQSRQLNFRGAAGLRLQPVTSTKGLTAEELTEIPEQLEAEVRRELGLRRSYHGAEVIAA